jgi:acetylornithine deacetylase
VHARTIEQAIVCEPTGCRVGTRHRGILALEAQLDGRGGHSSRADELPAPVAELAHVAVAWDALGRRYRGVGPTGFPGLCFNVAKLDGGVAFNVVPERATLCASLRPPPGSDPHALRAELAALAAQAAPEARVTVTLDNAPFATGDLGAFRRWLGDAVDAPIDLGFWTEAALLAATGIDAVVFGPGDIAQAHAPDEWVAVEQLEIARRAFSHIIRSTGEEDDGAR